MIYETLSDLPSRLQSLEDELIQMHNDFYMARSIVFCTGDNVIQLTLSFGLSGHHSGGQYFCRYSSSDNTLRTFHKSSEVRDIHQLLLKHISPNVELEAFS